MDSATNHIPSDAAHDVPVITADAAVPNPPIQQETDDSEFVGDKLVAGVSLMLVLTVVQRAVGFLRNILVCRLMEPADLGLWNLAETTLFLAAPLLVLGIPGTINRYVEHYRQKGQLRAFLLRISSLTVLLMGIGIAFMAWNHEWVRRVAFGNTNYPNFVAICLATLSIVIVYNFFVELLVSLRQVKTVSYVNFANSLIFGIVAVALLSLTELRAAGVVIAYGVACVTTVTMAAFKMKPAWRMIGNSAQPLPHRQLWARVLPFAGWLCISDFLDNTFVAVDRYMIIHFSSFDKHAALELVGQYHCSRILGVLLVSVASMLATVILPYMTHDWERQRKRAVSSKLNFGIKSVGLVMMAASMAVIILGPIIFDWLLGGKYAAGFGVLPCTMTYCIWFGLVILAQPYLFCAEKTALRASAIAVGMFVNISLNALLLPSFGLQGAVWATSLANLMTLLVVFYFCHKQGMTITPGLWVVTALPLCLLLPTIWMIVASLAVAGIAYANGWLFTRWERRQIAHSIAGLRAKFA